MVSVMAVKIQFSSPIGVLRSETLPGMLWASRKLTLVGRGFCKMKKRTAMVMGSVRQEVKISAGSSGLVGSDSRSLHAAKWMQSLKSTCSTLGSLRRASSNSA